MRRGTWIGVLAVLAVSLCAFPAWGEEGGSGQPQAAAPAPQGQPTVVPAVPEAAPAVPVAAPPPAVPVIPAALPPGPGTGLEAKLPPAPTDAQGITSAKEAVDQLVASKALNGAAKRKAILLGLAAAFTFLIYLLRRWTVLFLNKQVVAAFAVILGAAVFVLTNVAGGVPLWQSVEVALAGPGSLVVYAVLQLANPESWAKAADKAKEKAAARGKA